MKHIFFTICLLGLITQYAQSQQLTIKGDTTFWYPFYTTYHSSFQLQDFTQSQNDFRFRFWTNKQVIEITQDSHSLTGEITNFAFHKKRRDRVVYGFWGFFNRFVKFHPTDTIVQKVKLDSLQTQQAFDVIQHSGILELPTDRDIESWSQGTDGITYFIEHTDDTAYWFKNYWTPTAQDSFPEALLVQNFVENLSDTLQLKESYLQFRNTWRKQGCYQNFGIYNMCYSYRSFGIGYTGFGRLPLGYTTRFNLRYIGNLNTDIDFRIYHYFGFQNENSNLSIEVIKGPVFINGNVKPIEYDFLNYQYQRRRLDFLDANSVFQNHRLKYGVYTRTGTEYGVGVDYLQGSQAQFAPLVHFYQWFPKPKIGIQCRASFFSDNVDYRIVLSKPFRVEKVKFLNTISFQLFFENFQTYNDVGIAAKAWF